MRILSYNKNSDSGGGWLLSVLLVLAIQGEAAPDFPGTQTPTAAVWELGPMTGNSQTFRVTITGFSVTNLPEGLVLSIPGQAAARSPGMPDLPLVSTLLRGQAGQSVHVEVTPPQWVVIPGIRVAPAESPALDETTGEASETRLVRTPLAAVYGTDAFWPADLVRVTEAWIGTEKRLRLECALMQHNPSSQLLRYTLVLEGRLVFEPENKPGKP